MTDTIFALSSGQGRAGVAVVRVSGQSLQTLFAGIVHKRQIKPRYAYLAGLQDVDGAIIDQAIAIYFAAPNSFTGEDIIEFHVHGSMAVIEKLFETLRAYGARMAAPGEFTRRAFDNGKKDLVEVDGLCALLDSRTDAQRRAALRAAAGTDSAVYEKWRTDMIEIAAYSAAMLDYPADELPENIGAKLLSRTRALHDEIGAALTRAGAARSVRSGFNIALVGPVNVGKSSLFNRLVGESRAIVSDIPGTTRDVVSAEINIDGYLVRLLDTAGLRDTTDTVEKMGIARTQDTVENADLVIRVWDVECGMWKEKPEDNEIIVCNKCDLKDNSTLHIPHSALSVSAVTGAGIDELLARIRDAVHAQLQGAESEVVVNARAKELLEIAVGEMEQGVNLHSGGMDVFSEHIRRAADAIGKILGVISPDEVMDSIFGQLCLGK